MTGAHVHLLFNHFPITGGLVALALLAYGWLSRKDAVVRAAAGLFVAIALLTAVTYLSGEPAEHVLERMPGFNEELVEEHEEAALFALLGYALVGLLALYTLVRYARREISRGFATALLLASLLTVAIAARVAWLGGPISHEEVRSGTAAPAANEAAEDH
jgi:uncharacterized membrane protein